MDQTELELKIDVWKKLALSKQMLISVAIDSLGLDPECKMDEFKKELDLAITKGKNAEDTISQIRKEANDAIMEMENKVTQAEKLVKSSKQEKETAIKAKASMEKSVIAARETNAAELKKAQTQLGEKDKALKMIKVALADSPENVVRKLKNLKKEKFDESTARKRAEEEARTLKKDKQRLEKEHEAIKKVLEQSTKLATLHRELHALSTAQHGELEKLHKGETAPEKIPELDETLLEGIEQAANQDKSANPSSAKKKTDKKKR